MRLQLKRSPEGLVLLPCLPAGAGTSPRGLGTRLPTPRCLVSNRSPLCICPICEVRSRRTRGAVIRPRWGCSAATSRELTCSQQSRGSSRPLGGRRASAQSSGNPSLISGPGGATPRGLAIRGARRCSECSANGTQSFQQASEVGPTTVPLSRARMRGCR